MAAGIALMVLMGIMTIRQDTQDTAEIRRIEAQQMNAPRRRRRAAYVDHYAR